MDTLQETFGERVKTLRGKQNLNQGELAAKIGIRQSTLSDIERGCNAPTLRTVAKIAKALGVQAKALLS